MWRRPPAYLCYYAASVLVLFCDSLVVILLFAVQGLAFCRAPALACLELFKRAVQCMRMGCVFVSYTA